MSDKKRKSIFNTTIKSTLKNAFSKANPFDKKINKNDVSDTGTETVRLAYRSIKTVKKSVKTTQRTIKTVAAITELAGNIVVNAAAFLMNPIVIFLALIIVTFILDLFENLIKVIIFRQ